MRVVVLAADLTERTPLGLPRQPGELALAWWTKFYALRDCLDRARATMKQYRKDFDADLRADMAEAEAHGDTRTAEELRQVQVVASCNLDLDRELV